MDRITVVFSFLGQMLINWFLSSLSNKAVVNQKNKNNERYTLALQFCTQLLSLGVIQQIIDKNAAKEDVFKVILYRLNCMVIVF